MTLFRAAPTNTSPANCTWIGSTSDRTCINQTQIEQPNNACHIDEQQHTSESRRATDLEEAYRRGSNDFRQTNQTQARSQRPYKPMITFAPEKIQHRVEYGSLQPRSSLNTLFRPAELHPESAICALPFDFMPKEQVRDDIDVEDEHNSSPVQVSAIVQHARSLAGKAWRLLFGVGSSSKAVHPLCTQQQLTESVNLAKLHRLDQQPEEIASVKSDLTSSDHWSIETTSRPTVKPGCVKNPKEMLPPVPSGWEWLFTLQPGDWRCRCCNFKNSADAMTCDCCTAVRVDKRPTEKGEAIPVDNPSADTAACAMAISPLSSNSQGNKDETFHCAQSRKDVEQVKSTLPTNNDSRLKERDTKPPSQESRAAKRNPVDSPTSESSGSKRSKAVDVVPPAQTEVNETKNEHHSHKRQSAEFDDLESNSKRASFDKGKSSPESVRDPSVDWMELDFPDKATAE